MTSTVTHFSNCLVVAIERNIMHRVANGLAYDDIEEYIQFIHKAAICGVLLPVAIAPYTLLNKLRKTSVLSVFFLTNHEAT